jgi:hypothetical protein
MGTRPLRHHYGDDALRLRADPALGAVVEPWIRHRERFAAALGSFDDERWAAPSRCDAWSNRELVCHLIDVDAYWTMSLESGRGGEAITFLRDFDPTATPLALVAAKAALSNDDVLDAFATNTAGFRKTVEALDDREWESAVCESPIGHVPARVMLAHALWDSWLHERDALVDLGLATTPEPDELGVVAWYSLLFGGAQGGLLDDPDAVGLGAADAIEVDLAFDDLPDHPLRVRVDADVFVGPGDTASAMPAGSALAFVESLTGRAHPFPPTGATYSTGLDEHLARARQIL